MKYLVKFFVITFLLLVSTYSFAEQKLAYIDMKYVLNSSKAGKGAQDFLQNKVKKDQKEFLNIEKSLKKQEKDLLAKKPDITKEEYKKKADELRKQVIAYQNKRKSSFDKIAKLRTEARQNLLKKLNPILKSYIEENMITAVLDKKNIIIGNTDDDITKVITEKLNKELPSLNLN
jgi:Skp family chaperone for outer membrane proteins